MQCLWLKEAIPTAPMSTCDSELFRSSATAFSFEVLETFAKMTNECAPLESFPTLRFDVLALSDPKL